MNPINFDKMQGLVPAIVQETTTGEVLMLGFMNREAYARSLEDGFVTFFSRSRQQLWTKGETSGNRLEIISIEGGGAGAVVYSTIESERERDDFSRGSLFPFEIIS